jgi:hypothetical protein
MQSAVGVLRSVFVVLVLLSAVAKVVCAGKPRGPWFSGWWLALDLALTLLLAWVLWSL